MKLRLSLWVLAACFSTNSACAEPTLDDLWDGRARFEQVRDLNYGALHVDGVPTVSAGWYVVANRRWYAFGRAVVGDRPAYCRRDHTQVTVSESRDKGATWSRPVVVVSPGASSAGDGCAILDGSTYYDQSTGTWHLLAQCLDRQELGGWSLCHYTRRASTPLGPFVPDGANPVVRGGALWKTICAGIRKRCPSKTADEGTPDIVEKKDGQFIVTLHGYDGKSGYRTVVATPNFREWHVAGSGLPNDATLTKSECSAWFTGCVGFGQGSAVRSGGRIYMIAEVMDRSLLCQDNQKWAFALLRSQNEAWPRSGLNEWEGLRSNPLVRATTPSRAGCQVAYARWLIDGPQTYLIYEEWDNGRRKLRRRLLKLAKGSGPPITLM